MSPRIGRTGGSAARAFGKGIQRLSSGVAVFGTVWSSSGNASETKTASGQAGLKNAAIIWGGNTNVGKTTVETFDGSTWTTGTALPSQRGADPDGSANGSPTAVLSVGGYAYPGGRIANTDAYNGSSWTAGTAYPEVNNSHGGVGTTTSCLIVGGDNNSTTTAACNTYNGSSWTAAGSLNTAISSGGCAGESTSAALNFGGYINGSAANAESYNGSTWSVIASLTSIRYSNAGCGTQNAALSIGGYSTTTNTNISSTLHWNGTAWSAGGNLITARAGAAAAGTSASAMATCGDASAGYIQSTETYA